MVSELNVVQERRDVLKVLLSAYSCEPNRGSEPGNGWNTAIYLARAGVRVWVLTRSSVRAAIEENTPKDLHLRFVYVDIPSRWQRVLPTALREHAQYLLWQRLIFRTAVRLDREVGFDLIHHVTWGSLTAGSWLWGVGKPFIFGPVGGGQIAPRAFLHYFGRGGYKERFRSFVVKHITPRNPLTVNTVRNAEVVLSTNSDTQRIVDKIGANRSLLLLDACLPPEMIPPVAPIRHDAAVLRVLWVGRLLPRKALNLALDAIARVDSTVPLRLTILGGGPLGTAVPGWIRDRGLADRVQWKGQVSWAEVQAAYLEHDVFLFTSLRDSSGAQLLEAMAEALPIVMLNHHGGAEFVPDDAALKVPVTRPSDTVDGIARALEFLYHHPSARVQMGKTAWEFARRQTWDQRASQYLELYTQVLESRQGANRVSPSSVCRQRVSAG